MPVLSNAQIIALWLKEGGSFATSGDALARALSESSGNTAVTSSNPNGGTNVGLYQLDTTGVGSGYTVSQLQDPYTNTQVTVKATSDGQNWGEWSDNWTSYQAQANKAVAEYQDAMGSGQNSVAYMNSQLSGVSGVNTGPSGNPVVNVPSVPGLPAGSATSPQTQSLTSQAASVISDAEDLFHGAAEALNWFWEWWEPGQGWRLAFGAGAIVLGYVGLRQWGLVPSVKAV
jgi:hypothetical protein